MSEFINLLDGKVSANRRTVDGGNRRVWRNPAEHPRWCWPPCRQRATSSVARRLLGTFGVEVCLNCGERAPVGGQRTGQERRERRGDVGKFATSYSTPRRTDRPSGLIARMSWRRGALWAGCVLGVLLFLLGVTGLTYSQTDAALSPARRAEDIVLASLFMVTGLAMLVACIVGLRRKPVGAPSLQIGFQTLAAPPAMTGSGAPVTAAPIADLTDLYTQWFEWCRREIGGDAISLHAATMAALRFASTGDSGRASQAARQASTPGPRARVRRLKVRLLARTAASTLPGLEPDEKVLVSLFGVDKEKSLRWELALGWIGYLITNRQLRAYFLTVTDRRVIALLGMESDHRPQFLAFEVPRSAISEATYQNGIFYDLLSISRVTGERTKLTVMRIWRGESALVQQLLAPGPTQTRMPASPTMP